MTKVTFGDEWIESPDRRSLLRLMRDAERHRRQTGRRFVNVLARLRLVYAADPELVALPHGLERLRRAYSLYLSEARPGLPVVGYVEGRDHLRNWATDCAPKPASRNRRNPHQD